MTALARQARWFLLTMKLASALGRKDSRRTLEVGLALLELDETDTLALNAVADAHREIGDEAASLEMRRRLLAIDPDHFRSLQMLAHHFLESGEEPRAHEYFTRALTVAGARQQRWAEQAADWVAWYESSQSD